MILITLESNVKMLPFDDAAFWAGKIKWWSRRWRGLECNESIDGWEAKEVAALQRIRHHLSRDESTFNLKQNCDQRNLEDSFIGIIVGRLGGRLLWVFSCFRIEPFLTFFMFALSYLSIGDTQNIYLCVSLYPLYLDFSWDETVNSEKVCLFCCAVALRLNVGSAWC